MARTPKTPGAPDAPKTPASKPAARRTATPKTGAATDAAPKAPRTRKPAAAPAGASERLEATAAVQPVAASPAAAAVIAETPTFYLIDEHEHPEGASTMLGFWIYLMSDCLIFAMLFATFGVLGGNYAAGPGPKEVLELPLVAVNTSLLLLSSITYGFAMLAVQRGSLNLTRLWMVVTGLLGLGFIGIELTEFSHLIAEGAGPERSAFLSSFFTLVGTHGLHVTFGIIWLVTLLVQISRNGLIPANRRRLMCLSMFWHFLDVIWIGVFTFVYLMGSLR